MPQFTQLTVWRRAHDLVLAIYRGTAAFPKEERYGLRNQIRKAAVSVPANIAEGSRRGSDADFRRFLRVALGSAAEVEYYLLLARDLGYLPASAADSLAQSLAEVMRMLTALVKSCEPRASSGEHEDADG